MSRWVLSDKAKRDLRHLRIEHPHIYRQIQAEMDEGIDDDPTYYKNLRQSLQGIQSCRVGDHRVLYRVDKNGYPYIIGLGHRANIYQHPIF